jgi:hypothetical protein
MKTLNITPISREGVVLIKARPGSKRFTTMGGMTNKHSATREDGTTSETNLGEYLKERFPKSRQFFRGAPWSHGKKKYLLRDFPDNSPELNALVKGARLRHEKGELKGKFIESCDIYDLRDPFLNHSGYKKIGEQGDGILDKSNDLDFLILQGLVMNPKFAYSSSEDLKGLYPMSVRYIIVDKGFEKGARKAEREKEMKVKGLYENLNGKKRLAIAFNLGLVRSEDTDPDMVDDLLWEYANSKDIVSNSGESKQDLFLRMCSLDTEKLNMHTLIAKAKAEGYLKKTKQGWLLFGNSVGKPGSFS